jgi:DNA-binding NarL/FixJ family response regulator
MNKQPDQIDIVIADDHPIFREGLRRVLCSEPGFRVVGEAANGSEAVEMVRRLKPALLLLDVRMPGLTGLEVLRELQGEPLPTRIIILTAALEESDLVESLQLGARGILLKHLTSEIIIKGLRCVLAGQYWVERDSASNLVRALLELAPPQSAPAAHLQDFGLTPREKEVIALIAAGYTNSDIAQKFGISGHTVKHHLTSIFDKLGVSNRLELLLFAVNHRLNEKD